MNTPGVSARVHGDRFVPGRHAVDIVSSIKRSMAGCRVPSFAATLAVLELARKIESSAIAAASWYRDVPIRELGNLPARQLVALGEAESVVAFLESVQRGDRD